MNPLNLTELNSPARQYSAAIDSVNLITALLSKPDKTKEDIDCILRNKEHIEIILADSTLTSFDLTPFSNVINAVESADLSVSTVQDIVVPPEHYPDRPKFHKMASGSELWSHISTYTPGLASLLYTALTTSTAFDNTAVMSDIKNMMRGIVATLGDDHALHSTPSSVIINDPTDLESLPIPIGTLADHLDMLLSECWFGFSYADLLLE